MAGVPSRYYYNPQPEDRELTYRSAMLPIGTYRNEDGTESAGLAWPGMITEPLNALERLGSGGWSTPQDPASQQDMTTLLLSLYGGNALNPMASVPKGALASGAMREAKPGGITAWHGSPHDFEKFDLSKVGAGEGFAIAGHGLYFGEAKGTAEHYRSKLGGKQGHLYQVNLNLDPERVVDWERPMSEQSSAVQSAFRNLVWNRDWGSLEKHRATTFAESTAQQLYHVAKAFEVGDDKRKGLGLFFADWNRNPTIGMDRVSSDLVSEGVQGVRFMDQFSRKENKKALRSGGDLTHNYVVFDDNLVDILHKWRGDQQLYSDTGRPSLMGSALSSEQPNALDPYYRNGFLTY